MSCFKLFKFENLPQPKNKTKFWWLIKSLNKKNINKLLILNKNPLINAIHDYFFAQIPYSPWGNVFIYFFYLFFEVEIIYLSLLICIHNLQKISNYLFTFYLYLEIGIQNNLDAIFFVKKLNKKNQFDISARVTQIITNVW